MCLELGHEFMGWSEVLSIVAVVVAIGSLLTSYRGYRIAAFQALPHPRIGWESSSTGHRSLDFRISRSSGDPDWVVAADRIWPLSGVWRQVLRLLANTGPGVQKDSQSPLLRQLLFQ